MSAPLSIYHNNINICRSCLLAVVAALRNSAPRDAAPVFAPTPPPDTKTAMSSRLAILLLCALASSTAAAPAPTSPPGLAFFPVNAPKGKTVQNLCSEWKAACRWVAFNVCAAMWSGTCSGSSEADPMGAPHYPPDLTPVSGCTYIKGSTKRASDVDFVTLSTQYTEVNAFCHAEYSVPKDSGVVGVQELTVATARYLKTTVPAYTGVSKGNKQNPYLLYYKEVGDEAESYLIKPKGTLLAAPICRLTLLAAGNVKIGSKRSLQIAYKTASWSEFRFNVYTSAVDIYLVNAKKWGNYRVRGFVLPRRSDLTARAQVGTLKPYNTLDAVAIAGNFTIPAAMCGQTASMSHRISRCGLTRVQPSTSSSPPALMKQPRALPRSETGSWRRRSNSTMATSTSSSSARGAGSGSRPVDNFEIPRMMRAGSGLLH
jgi:hypothetical protein